SNLDETVRAVHHMRQMGCRVAIDDFGAGYTSFSHLRDMPIDMVKMDGSFCQELKSDPRNAAFLEAMQRLADRFEVKTVVEWVEDAETAALLKAIGCTYLQGSFFGMPLAVLPWERKRELSADAETSESA
ncbi:MAG: EAL domain-containing protein, partial [Pseudomonadota bacterium]